MDVRRTEVLVVGAGPAGASAAAWAARSGREVLLADAATFPRDKTCGDGLTPRAVAELDLLGLGDWVREHTVNFGLRAHGFGQTLLLPWPDGNLPNHGSAVARSELDHRVRAAAIEDGANTIQGARAVGATYQGDRVDSVEFHTAAGPVHVKCERLVVADGVRSPLGKVLGREWHRDTAYGVAARSYVTSDMHEDPWISSHLELRDEDKALLSGYGWIFPLGNGMVNLGAGTLATSRRPAQAKMRDLMKHYARARREEFGLHGDLQRPTSALLPMGGAVSNVAGPNWALVGDAAGCVNPLNGEGIDYGLETGRMLVDLLEEDLSQVWPAFLRDHYGEAFSIARRLAGIATMPQVVAKLGPPGMRSRALMTLALRWMGNIITDEDRDLAARLWRWAGTRSIKLDARPPFS